MVRGTEFSIDGLPEAEDDVECMLPTNAAVRDSDGAADATTGATASQQDLSSSLDVLLPDAEADHLARNSRTGHSASDPGKELLSASASQDTAGTISRSSTQTRRGTSGDSFKPPRGLSFPEACVDVGRHLPSYNRAQACAYPVPRFAPGTVRVATSKVKRKNEQGQTILNETYIRGKTIGQGSYAKVKEYRRVSDGAGVAAKVFERTALAKERFGNESVLVMLDREINIMKQLRHERCIQLYEVIESPETDEVYVMMELCEGGPVYAAGDAPISEDMCRKYMLCVMEGMAYLHGLHVVHCDIKNDNILLTRDKNACKIVDFGLSFVYRETDYSSREVGNNKFAPPEVLDPTVSLWSGRAADMWSAGITLFLMRFGRLPFSMQPYDEDHEEILHKLSTEVEFPAALAVSSGLKSFLGGLLEKDPAMRLSASESLRHEWLQGCQARAEQ
mmetsp:Transcript_1393/g.4848  ORF Transcript_1393/g.4848 Transcript_1393/m.4848 type:complete len:448 (-) Transcript_1393:396-1739(-)